MKCYKRLIYKQFVQVSGLCGPQFLSYLSKRFTQLCRALYGDAILVHRFGAPKYGRRKSTKTCEVHYFYNSSFFFTRELAYVRINISVFFFNETTFLFWCHALRKLGSSNYCIFEMKHVKGMGTCTKIYFLFIFNLV